MIAFNKTGKETDYIYDAVNSGKLSGNGKYTKKCHSFFDDKYGWVDIGSTFLPSEITSAFLYAKIEEMDKIQSKRLKIWNEYYDNLKVFKSTEKVILPNIPSYASNNGHMFYLVCKDIEGRNRLTEYLKSCDINTVFHYQSLHKSPFYKKKYNGRK